MHSRLNRVDDVKVNRIDRVCETCARCSEHSADEKAKEPMWRLVAIASMTSLAGAGAALSCYFNRGIVIFVSFFRFCFLFFYFWSVRSFSSPFPSPSRSSSSSSSSRSRFGFLPDSQVGIDRKLGKERSRHFSIFFLSSIFSSSWYLVNWRVYQHAISSAKLTFSHKHE